MQAAPCEVRAATGLAGTGAFVVVQCKKSCTSTLDTTTNNNTRRSVGCVEEIGKKRIRLPLLRRSARAGQTRLCVFVKHGGERVVDEIGHLRHFFSLCYILVYPSISYRNPTTSYKCPAISYEDAMSYKYPSISFNFPTNILRMG